MSNFLLPVVSVKINTEKKPHKKMWDWNFFYFPTIMNWNIVNCAGWTESLLGVKYHIRVSWIQYKSNIILQHLEKYFRVQSSQPLTVVGKFQGDVVRAVSSFERTSVPDPVLIRSSVVAVHFSQNILYWEGTFTVRSPHHFNILK